MHGFLLEFGVSLPVGHAVIKRLPSVLAEYRLPARLVTILERLHAHFKYLDTQISEIDKKLSRQLADNDFAQRLLTIPGIDVADAQNMLPEGSQPPCYK